MPKNAIYVSAMIDSVKKASEIVGGVTVLANMLGCSRQSLYQWDNVPRGRVLEIEELTGKKVRRFDMRPDIYPPPKR